MTTEYAGGTREAGHIELVLANAEVAIKGEMACVDTSTGTVKVGQTSTTLIPIGKFAENKTGDGTATVKIDLLRLASFAWWDNDSGPNAVDAGDIGSEVYIKDGRTVSALSTGRSKAGRVWAVSSTRGVLIEAGVGVTGPTGANGSGISNGSVASRTALTAVAAGSRFDGQLVMVLTDGSLWRFVAASAVNADGAGELALAPDAGTGRWLRADKSFTMKLAISKDTADAAALCTVPAQMALRLTGMPYWEVTTGWTGGSSSAIGVSASAIATTKGDLLGGASGQLTAVLGTSGIKAGTVGPLIDTVAEQQAFFLKAADYLRFDRITSAYTAGDGFVCVPVTVATVA